MFTIEKDIPAPLTRGKYPFANMGVGDSFLVPNAKIGTISSASTAFAKAHKKSWKFTARVVEGGVRVWRIK